MGGAGGAQPRAVTKKRENKYRPVSDQSGQAMRNTVRAVSIWQQNLPRIGQIMFLFHHLDHSGEDRPLFYMICKI